MAQDTHLYGEVNSKTGLQDVFQEIRHDVDNAKSRQGLTELYRRAGYLITLTHAPSMGREVWPRGRVAPPGCRAGVRDDGA